MSRLCKRGGLVDTCTLMPLVTEVKVGSQTFVVCAPELQWRGGTDGQQSWHVRLDVPSPVFCLDLEDAVAWTVTCRSPHDVEREWRLCCQVYC